MVSSRRHPARYSLRALAWPGGIVAIVYTAGGGGECLVVAVIAKSTGEVEVARNPPGQISEYGPIRVGSGQRCIVEIRGKRRDRVVGVVECDVIADFSRVLVRVKDTQTPFENPARRGDEAQLLRELLEVPVIFTLSQARRDRAAA